MKAFLLVTGDTVDVEDAVAGWRTMSPATRDAFLIFSALLFVSLVILIWAVFIRKPGRRRRVRRRHSESQESRPAAGIVPASNTTTQERGRRRRRHRRGEHRPRNPTLAETGGLPPVRPDEPGEATQ